MNTGVWYTVRPGLRATASVIDLTAASGLRRAYGGPVEPLGRSYLVTAVEVREERGQGHASNLLRQIIRDADAEGATLLLSVESDGTGLSDDALRLWYARHGFVSMTGSERGMVREPKRGPSE
jgi:GNAT superfamily N-acetyltransferase